VVTRSKCKNKTTMERWFSVICVFLFVSELCAQSPCPGIFDYQNEGGEVTGLIKIPPSRSTTSIVTRVKFSIAARLPSVSNFILGILF
jgi:hypothetical protein